jgi:hypothetical protein
MRRFLRVTIGAWCLLAGASALAAGSHSPIIVTPKNGATVSNPVKVVIDLDGAQVSDHPSGPLSGMAGMPAAGDRDGDHDQHGHAHLIVDSPLPKPGTMVPMDARHIHMMGGETTTTLTLSPGKHTLQLIMGRDDHIVPPNAPRSRRITIMVR